MVLTKRRIKNIYFVMILIGVGFLVFSWGCAIVSNCNQYSVSDHTGHGITESISYCTADGERDVIHIHITEGEYKRSLCSFGLRKEIAVVNQIPDELIRSDRAVGVIGDHLMKKYNDDLSRADAARRIVQSIEYCSDSELYGVDDFWARPTETLYNLKGDCEDLTVLFCSLCNYMGIETVILDSDSHECAGVRLDWCPDNEYYLYGGERYYVCELTSIWKIGQRPVFDMTPYKDEPSYMYYFYTLCMSSAYRTMAGFERLLE